MSFAVQLRWASPAATLLKPIVNISAANCFSVATRRKVHSVEMQIRAAVLGYVVNVGLILATVKAIHSGFGDSSKIRRTPGPVPLTLDLLNPKSIGFDRLSRT